MYDDKDFLPFTVHFEVPQHYLSLDDFIDTAKATESILKELNKKFTNGKAKIKIVVLPPEEGSFKKKLGVILLVGGAAFTFISSDIGKGFVRGLTGHDPEYWAQGVGEDVNKCLVVLLKTVEGFLKKDAIEIEQMGIHRSDFPALIEAKNRFYETCIRNPEILGLGFDGDEGFPVSRDSFIQKIANSDDDEYDYDYKIHQFVITSPVTSSKSDAQWRGRDKTSGDNMYFRMDDADFLFDFLNNGKYPIKRGKEDDELLLLIEYKTHKITGKVEHVAKKVFRFNNIEIFPLPKDSSIEIFEKIADGISENQQSLF